MRKLQEIFGYSGTLFSIGHILPLKIAIVEAGAALNQILGTVVAILTIIYWLRKLNDKKKK